MTILIHFHQFQYRHFKAFYLWQVCRQGQSDFPNRLRYQRFVALIPTALLPLRIDLHTPQGKKTGLAFIDSTSLVVCHPRRIQSHKVFRPVAHRGKVPLQGAAFCMNLNHAFNGCPASGAGARVRCLLHAARRCQR